MQVIAAEMENRLRESVGCREGHELPVLRVLRPTLSQVSELDMLHRDLKRRVDEDGKSIGKVDELQSDVIKNGHLVKALEEAVTSTSDQVRDMEATSSKRFVQLQTAFDLSQSTLSGYKNDIMRLEREDTRIWDEATRLQKQHDEDVSNNRDAVNGCHKRIIRVREECDAALLVMNQQREQLLEDLFGEDRGLSQLNKDLKKLTDFVSPIPDLIREMAENQRAVKNMAKRQEAFEKEFVQNRHDWQEYVQTQDVAVADMKATFKKECNFLVAHNSQIMKDIRRDYAKEMEHIQEMREGITKTLEQLARA
ncbi:unnamed protein product [Effrenium voratum]|nr:unnamed protein product [Effrenium voratum]